MVIGTTRGIKTQKNTTFFSLSLSQQGLEVPGYDRLVDYCCRGQRITTTLGETGKDSQATGLLLSLSLSTRPSKTLPGGVAHMHPTPHSGQRQKT